MKVGVVDCTARDAATRFVTTLRETGFAVLEAPPIVAADIEVLSRIWRDFFTAPPAARARFRHDHPDQAPLCGYWSMAESETALGSDVPDLKQFFHVLPGAVLPPAATAITERYRNAAIALARELLDWLTHHASRPLRGNDGKSLGDALAPEHSVLRLVHYPALADGAPNGAVRAAAHEDINLITILPVADAPGLEVQATDGSWHPVSGRPGQIVVNAGDMLAELSDGHYPSTTHRVVNPENLNSDRIAAPLFLTPALDTVLSSRYTAGAYLEERLQAISGGNQTLGATE